MQAPDPRPHGHPFGLSGPSTAIPLPADTNRAGRTALFEPALFEPALFEPAVAPRTSTLT